MPRPRRRFLMAGCALLSVLAGAAPVEADRRADVARLESRLDELDLLLLNKFSESFAEQSEGEWVNHLPSGPRMFLFLAWLDDRMAGAVSGGRSKPVQEIRSLAAALHQWRPDNLFNLYLLALTEHHLGRPEVAVELLAPVPGRVCDRRLAAPPYRFVAPGGGEAVRGPYLSALYNLQFAASRKVRSRALDEEREKWRLFWAYTRASVCAPPVQSLERERVLLRTAVAGEDSVRLPEPVVRRLAREHPVWSAVLPDGFFHLYALARWEEMWRAAGRSSMEDGAPIAPSAIWLAAAQRSHPGHLPGALFQAGYAEGRGRRREALNALEAFWTRRATPVPPGSLLLLASRHASLALREEGVASYLRQLVFYSLRGLEALPVSAGAVPMVYLTLAALCLADVALRASPRLRRFDLRLTAVTFAWWNRRQDSRLEVAPAADFPRPEDSWQEGLESQGSCELAQVVAALAAADDRLRRELVELLTAPVAPERLPHRWREALPPAADGAEETQRLLQTFTRLASGSPDYWTGLLRDLSFAQFEEADRPIVELVSNAVDATRQRALTTGEEMASVSISLSRGGRWDDRPCQVTVLDWGCGMSTESLLFDLLVPLTTTKEDSLATIGRFGVGFFSVLRYLARPDASVQVETADGRSWSRLRLTPPRRGSATGSPEVSLQVTPSERVSFTKVVVQGGIDRRDCERLLDRTFRFLPAPPVKVSGTQVNDLAPFQRLDAGGGVELLWRRHREPGPSALSLVIRGEAVGSPVELDLPAARRLEVGLCLPATAAVALSRNLPVVDERLAEAFQRAAAAARQLGFGGFTLLNLLAELAGRLYLHHREPHRRASLEDALCRAFEDLAQSGMVFLPLGPHMDRIDTRGMLMRSAARRPCVFLHPLLFSREGGRSLEAFRLQPGQPVYGLPLRELEEEGDDPAVPVFSVQCAGLTFLDERFQPRTAVGRAAIELLARTDLAEREVDAGSMP